MAEAATIARPYARAAFEFARDCKALAPWSEALGVAAALVLDARVSSALSSPNVSVDQIVGFFDGLGGAAGDAHWQNFVRLLATNKRLKLLPEIRAGDLVIDGSVKGRLRRLATDLAG